MRAINRRRFLIGAGAGAGAVALGSLKVAVADTPMTVARGIPYPELKRLVDERLEEAIQDGFPGMVIGAVSGTHWHAAGAGRVRGPGSPAPDVRTVFQIGSVSKTLTSTALAVAVRRGELGLQDPLAERMPRWLPAPPHGNGPIRLEHLAVHSSGLPPVPPGIDQEPGFDPRDPYAGFSKRDLAGAVDKTELGSEPGATYAYSNYGAGLLGHVLAARAGTTYARLVRRRVTVPLRMRDTTIKLSGDQIRRRAHGHDETGAPAPDWRFPTLAGTGAHYGAASDLLRYVRAHLGACPEHLAPALRLAAEPRFDAGDGVRLGLAWHISKLPRHGGDATWHTGITGGFRSFIGFSRRANVGITVLTNQNKTIDALAVSLLDSLAAAAEEN